MSSILETARLVLRPLDACDLPEMVAYLSDYEVAKNLTHVPHPHTMAHAQTWFGIRQSRLQRREAFAWSVLADGRFVGLCSVDHREGRFNLGYWYGRPHWGNGYATEAGQRAVRFAFEELGEPALVSGYYADNPASGRVLEKLGFEPAGFEMIHCVSRNATVMCNRVWLEAEHFSQRKAA